MWIANIEITSYRHLYDLGQGIIANRAECKACPLVMLTGKIMDQNLSQLKKELLPVSRRYPMLSFLGLLWTLTRCMVL